MVTSPGVLWVAHVGGLRVKKLHVGRVQYSTCGMWNARPMIISSRFGRKCMPCTALYIHTSIHTYILIYHNISIQTERTYIFESCRMLLLNQLE